MPNSTFITITHRVDDGRMIFPLSTSTLTADANTTAGIFCFCLQSLYPISSNIIYTVQITLAFEPGVRSGSEDSRNNIYLISARLTWQ